MLVGETVHFGSEIYTWQMALQLFCQGFEKTRWRGRRDLDTEGEGGAISFLHGPAPGRSAYEAPPLLLGQLQVPDYLRVARPHGPVVDVGALFGEAGHPGVGLSQLLDHLVVGLDGALRDGPERNPDDVPGPGEILVAVNVESVQNP